MTCLHDFSKSSGARKGFFLERIETYRNKVLLASIFPNHWENVKDFFWNVLERIEIRFLFANTFPNHWENVKEFVWNV